MMGTVYRAEEVFSPKSYPTYTYVDRLAGSSTYEKRMRRAIATPGNLVVVSGASKSGKTVLCHRVIGTDCILDLSGSQIAKPADFWEQIGEKLAVPMEVQVTGQASGSETKTLSGEGKLNLGVSIGAEKKRETASGISASIMQRNLRSNTLMMKMIIREGKVLVIDDFHYIPAETQQYIARTLKTELFNGLKAVILTLPHRSDDAIRLNPDLIGRTTIIDIAPWSEEELSEIAEKGFPLLGLSTSPDAVAILAQESIASPQLMQENCLSVALEAAETGKKEVSAEILPAAFSATAANYDYYDQPLRDALKGPAQGRERRKRYNLAAGGTVDGYKLLLLAVSKDPPRISFPVEEIRRRIAELTTADTGKLPALYISNIVMHVERSFRKSLPQLDTVEWKDKTLYILDPFLLFYLRWNQDWKK